VAPHFLRVEELLRRMALSNLPSLGQAASPSPSPSSHHQKRNYLRKRMRTRKKRKM
jgi:hypothetical protein